MKYPYCTNNSKDGRFIGKCCSPCFHNILSSTMSYLIDKLLRGEKMKQQICSFCKKNVENCPGCKTEAFVNPCATCRWYNEGYCSNHARYKKRVERKGMDCWEGKK